VIRFQLCSVFMTFTLFRAAKKRKKRKRAAFDDSGNVTNDKVKRIRREVETKIREAQINRSTAHVQYMCSYLIVGLIVVFSEFNFADAAAERPKMSRPPKEDTIWVDNISRSAKSGDNQILVYYLPRSIPQGTIVRFFSPYRYDEPHFIRTYSISSSYIMPPSLNHTQARQEQVREKMRALSTEKAKFRGSLDLSRVGMVLAKR